MGNCALIISEKSDEELKYWLYYLFDWIKDLDEPGALKIFNRLKMMFCDSYFEDSLEKYKKRALILNDEKWLNNINELIIYKNDVKEIEKKNNIDYIIEMLSGHNSEDKQEEGIRLARKVKNFQVFFQPSFFTGPKSAWENCASIICEKSDEELELYLYEMLEWLRDINWPGAFLIADRLKEMMKNDVIKKKVDNLKEMIKASCDEIWLHWVESELYNDFR